jgi:hypothetical protein
MVRFAIIATQRSGTNFFRGVLGGHPQIHCHDEVFIESGHDKPGYFYRHWLDKVAGDETQIFCSRLGAHMHDFLQGLESARADKAAVGVDVKYTEMAKLPMLLPVLRQRGYRFLHIVRRNVLKTMISQYHLDCKNGHTYPLYENFRRLSNGQVFLPVGDGVVERELARRQEQLEAAAGMLEGLPCLDLYYEDFFPPGEYTSDTLREDQLGRIYDFLEVPPGPELRTGKQKVNPSTVRGLVANFDDLAARFEGTRWAGLLD